MIPGASESPPLPFTEYWKKVDIESYGFLFNQYVAELEQAIPPAHPSVLHPFQLSPI
jgi:hypothetical protein